MIILFAQSGIDDQLQSGGIADGLQESAYGYVKPQHYDKIDAAPASFIGIAKDCSIRDIIYKSQIIAAG
ncbi:MAG: hypothetical protein K2N37_06750 [Lachnospiraceae bacterium]|nr:hypothetical protein [Lachnospiraceae bacterium]